MLFSIAFLETLTKFTGKYLGWRLIVNKVLLNRNSSIRALLQILPNTQEHLSGRAPENDWKFQADLNAKLKQYTFLRRNFRSSRPEVFCKTGVLKNFAKLTGKHLCQSLSFNKVASQRQQVLFYNNCFIIQWGSNFR